MPKPVHRWQQCLDRGKLGEAFLLKFYEADANPNSIDAYDGKLDTGCPVEFKTDFKAKPRNLFFERYKNVNKRCSGPYDGGPFAARGSATFFVYFFPDTGEIYWFPTGLLADKLEAAQDVLPVRRASNQNYDTEGFVVSIAGIRHLARCDRVNPELLSPELKAMYEELQNYVR